MVVNREKLMKSASDLSLDMYSPTDLGGTRGCRQGKYLRSQKTPEVLVAFFPTDLLELDPNFPQKQSRNSKPITPNRTIKQLNAGKASQLPKQSYQLVGGLSAGFAYKTANPSCTGSDRRTPKGEERQRRDRGEGWA